MTDDDNTCTTLKVYMLRQKPHLIILRSCEYNSLTQCHFSVVIHLGSDASFNVTRTMAVTPQLTTLATFSGKGNVMVRRLSICLCVPHRHTHCNSPGGSM